MIQAALSSNRLQVSCVALRAAGVDLSGPLNFDLNAGQVHVLRGSNGVGKSTLLRGLANALPHQAILFKPEFGLREELLVLEHLKILLAHLNVDAIEIEGLLTAVGLADWQFERVGTLSSGQRARLGLCRLLAGPYTVWLLDEPLNALDADGVLVLANAVAKHLENGGFLLVATHVEASVLMKHLPSVNENLLVFEHGKLHGAASKMPPSDPQLVQPPSNSALPFAALLQHDWAVLWGNPQSLLWGALFHWMVLSFFGIGLGKSSVEFAQVATWISLLLAVMLSAKDWFTEDHRVGWLRFVSNLNNTACIPMYWLVRVVCQAVCQIVVLVPVTGLLALQFGLSAQQSFQLLVAMAAGIWAIAPLLGLIALLVMLTRGGAVLVYLLALPLVVPVLIFGLEASQASGLGRSAFAPLAVLLSLGLLACLIGPSVAKRLVNLIQE